MAVSDYPAYSRRLADALTAAFPAYVRRRLDGQDVDSGTIGDAIDRAGSELAAVLDEWAATPATTQNASPLELFREALVGPTAALAEHDVPVVERDELQRQALPGDHYDLAPATSRDLGEDVFEAHIAWGIARAEVIAGLVPAPPQAFPSRPAVSTDQRPSSDEGMATPLAVLVGTDLMDRTRIAAVAEARSHTLAVWRNPGAIDAGLAGQRPVLGLVDLRHGAANDAIRMFAAAGIRVIAFGPHVDDLALAAARALGADEVMARSRFFRILPELFAVIV